ncbi:MAG: hypothetical protein ABS939_00415 [Psychrobacillus sp.]
MEITKDVWRIAEFGEKVNAKFQQKHGLNDKVHHNTIDKWFKELEEARVHYVQRIADKKVYSELDFNIALYIMDRRLEKWNLEAIYNVVGEVLEVRPFPEQFEFQAPVLNEQHLMNLLEAKMTEYKEVIKREVKLEMTKEIQLSLPKVKTDDELRMEKKEMMLNWAKTQLALKSKAIKAWELLEDSARFKRVGLFRKEEDLLKREKFIDDYIEKHLEETKNEL